MLLSRCIVRPRRPHLRNTAARQVRFHRLRASRVAGPHLSHMDDSLAEHYRKGRNAVAGGILSAH